MIRATYIGAMIGLLTLQLGCGKSSDQSQNVPPKAEPDDPVSELLARYERLPPEQQNGLAGDQIIMQLETLLKSQTIQPSNHAAKVVEEHNKKMVRRALEDPDLLEVTGTELAPTPRERD